MQPALPLQHSSRSRRSPKPSPAAEGSRVERQQPKSPHRHRKSRSSAKGGLTRQTCDRCSNPRGKAGGHGGNSSWTQCKQKCQFCWTYRHIGEVCPLSPDAFHPPHNPTGKSSKGSRDTSAPSMASGLARTQFFLRDSESSTEAGGQITPSESLHSLDPMVTTPLQSERLNMGVSQSRRSESVHLQPPNQNPTVFRPTMPHSHTRSFEAPTHDRPVRSTSPLLPGLGCLPNPTQYDTPAFPINTDISLRSNRTQYDGFDLSSDDHVRSYVPTSWNPGGVSRDSTGDSCIESEIAALLEHYRNTKSD